MKKYTTQGGRTITRITFVGKEGSIPFKAIWVEGKGNIGDKVIGRYSITKDWIPPKMSGEMFGG